MDNVYLRDLIPNDLEFDINIYMLKFTPDVCHPFGLHVHTNNPLIPQDVNHTGTSIVRT